MTYNISIKNIVMFLVLTSLTVGFSQVYEIRPHSQIVLKGASNINQFMFRSDKIDGTGYIDTSAARLKNANASIGKAIDVFFQVDVKTFDSGNSRMNGDMFDALKAEEYPAIEFTLVSLRYDRLLSQITAEFSVLGALRVAGVENTISLTVIVTQITNDLYHLQGSKKIRMTDYKIDPPKALFGLVQARDMLTVVFDFYASQHVDSALVLSHTHFENASVQERGDP